MREGSFATLKPKSEINPGWCEGDACSLRGTEGIKEDLFNPRLGENGLGIGVNHGTVVDIRGFESCSCDGLETWARC